MSSRQEVKVEHKVSVAALHPEMRNGVGEGKRGGSYRGKMGGRKGT